LELNFLQLASGLLVLAGFSGFYYWENDVVVQATYILRQIIAITK